MANDKIRWSKCAISSQNIIRIIYLLHYILGASIFRKMVNNVIFYCIYKKIVMLYYVRILCGNFGETLCDVFIESVNFALCVKTKEKRKKKGNRKKKKKNHK